MLEEAKRTQNKPGLEQSTSPDQLYFHVLGLTRLTGWLPLLVLMALITGQNTFIKLLSSEQLPISRNCMHASTAGHE